MAAPLEVTPRTAPKSDGLQVHPELDRLSRRLGGGGAATAPAPTTITQATDPADPGLIPGGQLGPTGRDSSPDVIFC